MTVSALREPGRGTPGPAAAATGSRTRRDRPPPPLPPRPAPALRLVTLLALVGFGAGHWMAQVEPAAGARAVAATGIAAGAALALLGLRGVGRRPLRAGGLAAVVAAGVAAAFVAAGLGPGELRPDRWAATAATVADGLDGLPGARVPYRGIDDGLRLVIPLGGTLLALAAALLAFWPRRDGRLGWRPAALLAAIALYAVPAVVVDGDHEPLRGALFALLVLAFWRGERLVRAQAVGTAVATLLVVGAAVAVAPVLDRDGPWFDYEEWVQDNAGGRTESFDWTHDYAALLWPRDGREMLRVDARARTYWKVETLDGFDGATWRVDPRYVARGDGDVDPANRRRFTQRLRVSIRSLRTAQLPLAGTTLAVRFPGRTASQLRPGVWGVGRELRRGDAYTATVYTPQPDAAQLQAAGTEYDPGLFGQTTFAVTGARLRSGLPAPRTTVSVAGFKGPLTTVEGAVAGPAAETLVRRSGLRRTAALAQRLAAGAATPFEYVRAVQAHLARPDFVYDEAPPPQARTLDGFLFDARAGFCQQYSGAMALLLRMGGVPAHVVTGFAPGAQNRRTGQFVVRDLDAHSWVEAYFPRIGWVTFDPTPSAAPPRAQASGDAGLANPGVPDVRDRGTSRAPAATAAPAAPPAAPPGEPAPPWPPLLGGLAALAAVGVAARRRWGRRAPASAVQELEAALRGAGRPVAADATLHGLEAQLRGLPDAAAYVGALRRARYGDATDGPTAAQRRRLRAALTRGRSPLARWRVWRALPPRPRGRPARLP